MTITGKVLRDAIISGANNISRQRQAVDELNVFPVPDGDTGTNMSMTIKNATAELKNASIGAGAGDIAKIAASAMLRGARGNSGVILSLIFRGLSKGLAGKETADAAAIISTTGMTDGGMPVPAGAGAVTAAGNTTAEQKAGRTTEENSAARAETAIMLPCA